MPPLLATAGMIWGQAKTCNLNPLPAMTITLLSASAQEDFAQQFCEFAKLQMQAAITEGTLPIAIGYRLTSLLNQLIALEGEAFSEGFDPEEVEIATYNLNFIVEASFVDALGASAEGGGKDFYAAIKGQMDLGLAQGVRPAVLGAQLAEVFAQELVSMLTEEDLGNQREDLIEALSVVDEVSHEHFIELVLHNQGSKHVGARGKVCA